MSKFKGLGLRVLGFRARLGIMDQTKQATTHE